jgi:hypothetical protein
MAPSCAVDTEAVQGLGIEFGRAPRRQETLRGPSVLVVHARLTHRR